MSEMKVVKFDEFVRLGRGFDLPESQIIEGKYPVVASTNIKAYHHTYKVNPPVVVTGRSGSLGKVQFINEKCWPLNTSLYSKDFRDNNPKYIYYYLQIMHLEQYNAGAGVPTLNQNHLQKLKIKVHEKDEQDEIAKILSVYDNLIKNNNKRIKVLEQMIEELYKEWFVRLRFPNNEYYDHKDIIKYYKLHELCSFSRGISYSSDEIDCEEGLDLINLKNINAFGGFRRDGYKKYNGKYKNIHVVNTGDLVMGITDMTQNRRTVGSVALIPTTNNLSVISADLVKINSNIDKLYLYCLFKYGEISKYISQFANGSNVLHLRPDMIKNVLIPVAKEELIDKFVKIIRPLFKEVEFLYLKNDNLIKQRDLLLPRLMSGKLEVK